MDQAISAADANRNFSRILREVRQGQTYVVTAHGKPVARIVPFAEADERRAVARAALMKRLEQQAEHKTTAIGPWTRDELYDC